jgi:hypothetical protein
VEGSRAPLPPSGRQMALRTVLAGGLVVGSLAKQCSVVGSVVEGSRALLPPSGRQMARQTVLAGLIVVGSLAKQG